MIGIAEKAEQLVAAKTGITSTHAWSAAEKQLYADLIDYVMFSRLAEDFAEFVDGTWSAPLESMNDFNPIWPRYSPRRFSGLGNRSADHLFAIYFQLYRAFRNIFDHLIGSSAPVIQLRGSLAIHFLA